MAGWRPESKTAPWAQKTWAEVAGANAHKAEEEEDDYAEEEETVEEAGSDAEGRDSFDPLGEFDDEPHPILLARAPRSWSPQLEANKGEEIAKTWAG